MGIKYQQEFICDIQDELRPLVEEEIKVGAFTKEYTDPMESYIAIEENIVLVSARSEGEIIGYIAFVKHPVFFLKDTLAAQSLGWFVKPEHRGSVGRELIEVCERYLKEDGVSEVYLGVRSEGFGAFMGKSGYSLDEITYKKDI